MPEAILPILIERRIIMFKQSSINTRSLTIGALFLTLMTGIQVSVAADMDTDPQVQAAHLLQHPLTWIASTDGFQQSGYLSDKALDPQRQAQHVLQPVFDVAAGGPEHLISGQFMIYELTEPQLRAAQILSHNPNQ